MIDYFALLDQPRAPWLDQEALKNAFHQKTRQEHPDVQAGGNAGTTDARFSNVNEAYQVLRDTKRRLHHLLSLEGYAPSSTDQTIPRQLHDLFPVVGGLTQRTKLLLERLQGTSNALSRSLLKPEILQAQNELKELREKIRTLSDASLAALRHINGTWAENPKEQIDGLSNLYFAFAYLARWSAQLDEMTFQLSLH